MSSEITIHYIIHKEDTFRDCMMHGDTLTFEKEYGYILYRGSRGEYVKPDAIYKIHIGNQEAEFHEYEFN